MSNMNKLISLIQDLDNKQKQLYLVYISYKIVNIYKNRTNKEVVLEDILTKIIENKKLDPELLNSIEKHLLNPENEIEIDEDFLFMNVSIATLNVRDFLRTNIDSYIIDTLSIIFNLIDDYMFQKGITLEMEDFYSNNEIQKEIVSNIDFIETIISRKVDFSVLKEANITMF